MHFVSAPYSMDRVYQRRTHFRKTSQNYKDNRFVLPFLHIISKMKCLSHAIKTKKNQNDRFQKRKNIRMLGICYLFTWTELNKSHKCLQLIEKLFIHTFFSEIPLDNEWKNNTVEESEKKRAMTIIRASCFYWNLSLPSQTFKFQNLKIFCQTYYVSL